ncbi:MAG: hypothetical protein APF76_05930 [Desulfitibacter sp. BRH_c19]|nr:MAG: hypothetical protein APF76_05930 [Desulfitibacter sp. BRH_c19]
MKKLFVLLLVLMLAAGVFTGCGSTGEDNVEPPASEEQTQGIEDNTEQEKEEINAVPLDPNLNYIDTEYLTNLMKNELPTSERVAYDESPPEWNFVLVDSRPDVKYIEGHINGAVSIPDAQFDEYPCRLPVEMDTMLIFYCGGLDCPLSSNSARKAVELGYTNVHVYQEGTPFWTEAGNYLTITPEYVVNLITEDYVNDIENKPVVIIDARPYNLYFKGHIPTAIQMDDTIFEEKYLNTVPADKSTEIITYCGGFFCGKSHFVAKILVDNGYTNVKVLAGGNPAWADLGYPLFGAESSGGSFDVSGSNKVDRGLKAEEWQKKLEAGGKVVVIDIRNDTEVAGGMIKGAIHIPDSEIHKDPQAIASKLPDDKETTLLIHCATGARSAGVVEKIAALGYANTFFLDGRIHVDAEGQYSF